MCNSFSSINMSRLLVLLNYVGFRIILIAIFEQI